MSMNKEAEASQETNSQPTQADNKHPVFKQGQRLLLESGWYSDYHVRGLFIVQKELDTGLFYIETPKKYCSASEYDTQRMINEGYLVDDPDVEFFHDGSY